MVKHLKNEFTLSSTKRDAAFRPGEVIGQLMKLTLKADPELFLCTVETY